MFVSVRERERAGESGGGGREEWSSTTPLICVCRFGIGHVSGGALVFLCVFVSVSLCVCVFVFLCTCMFACGSVHSI